MEESKEQVGKWHQEKELITVSIGVCGRASIGDGESQCTPKQWFPNFSVHVNHLEGLLEDMWPGLTPEIQIQQVWVAHVNVHV